MLKQLLIILFFVIIAVSELVFSHFFSLFGVKPDILLIAVVAWGFVRGSEEGILIGFLAGLCEDVFSSSFYLHIITKTFIGFLSGAVRGGVSTSLQIMYPLTCGIMTVMSCILGIVVSYFFFARQMPSAYSLIMTIFIAAVYNAALSAFLGPFFAKVILRIMGEDESGRIDYSLYRF
jgi:rod shape-determining protein MreD